MFPLFSCAAAITALFSAHQRNGSVRFRLMLAAIIVALGGSGAARAGGVVSTCDEPSLRAALAGGGLVTFSCGSTITLAATIQFTTNTSIDGSGQNVTISGGGNVQVLFVNSGVTLSLNNLTIANGKGAPYQSGGGAQNQGMLIVTNSTFSGNSTTDGDGGGIYNSRATLIVINSTFSGNSTLGGGSGGGIYETGGTLVVTNSTFSGNTASNGGGIYANSGGVTLRNTVLANNGGACGGFQNPPVTDGGYNLDDDGSCGFTAPTSLSDNKNANLGLLSNNGGPTQTIPLLPNSAAIGAIPPGTNGCATTVASDQRGIARPESVNGNCSIGAYEYVPPADTTITNCSDDSQLQAAVGNGGRIVFACSGTIPLASTAYVRKNTSIDASGQSVRLDGGSQMQVLNADSVTLVLNNLTIQNGKNALGGGVSISRGALVVNNSTFSGNSAPGPEGFGGGISDSFATSVVNNSTFSGNSASDVGLGGGIANHGGSLMIDNSTFSGNSAHASANGPGLGGAINNDASLMIANSTFSGNSADTYAGGIYSNGSVTLQNTVVVNNRNGNCLVIGSPDAGYNLDDDGSCGFSSANHSLSNNKKANLGSLSNNGGPTYTIPLLSGSVAIDAIPLLQNGCGTTIFTDQRGLPRPQGFACDIGAFETTQFPVTFTTSPAGLSYTVDGATYSSQQTLQLTPGSHTITASSPQPGPTGTQYIWQSWSDNGDLSHQIAVFAPASYTANFQTQYLLTTAANPSAGGTVTPPSGQYYATGSQIQLTAMPNSGYAFTGWIGTVTSSTNPLTVTMNSPVIETANFAPTVQATVGTNPSGLFFSVDGTPYTATQTLAWVVGSTHTIATTSPQSLGKSQYGFASWSDGGAISHQVIASKSTTSYTAKFTSFTITPNPSTETIYRGAIAGFILDLKSVNGFSGNVKLSCAGGPAGSYCVDFPMSVHLNGTAYAVSGILFPKNTKSGTYAVTFTGISGSLTNTATAKFTVK